MAEQYPTRILELIHNNEEFVKTWPQPPSMLQLRATAKRLGNAVLILTCLDPRCVPEAYFGPNLRAAVIRNAGGRASQDVVRSITVIRALMNAKYVLVVHHTDCGLTHLTDDEIRETAKRNTPDAAAEVENEVYGCFTADDYEETIKKDVITLRNTKALEGMTIYGFDMDIDSGVVRPVDV